MPQSWILSSRRKFLAATGASILLGIANAEAIAGRNRRQCWCAPVCPPYVPVGPSLRVRQNIAALNAVQLQSLRTGVAAMKALPDSDPRSWRFQANIHRTLDSVMNPLFNQCEHGTLLFLAWHRGYLHYFERILRWASGDQNLTLPYWNWSTAPTLPLAYRQPASASNSLYDDTRNINDGSALPPEVVVDDLNTALNELSFPPAGGPGFSFSLEGSPHGAVHVLIGGMMSSVPTAANDPIFWLHHGNIDRVWNRWLNLNSGRINPSDAAYLDTRYSFADESGRTVTRTVRELSNSEQLGYCYDDIPNPPTPSPAPASPGRTVHAMTQRQTIRVASSREDDTLAEPKSLGFKAETVKLQLSERNRAALKARSVEGVNQPNPIVLQIEGLSVAEPPNFTYGIYLNLPAEEVDPARIKTHYVAALNLFGKEGHGKAGHHHAEGEVNVETFDVTSVIARLQKANRWNPDALSVTFRPLTPIPPRGGERALLQRAEASAQKAKITYQRISLLAAR